MPEVEAPFIIAVIREKEKYLLGDQEITRILHTSSLSDAREQLMSTPYGVFLVDGVPLQTGLVRAMEAEFLWLRDSLDNADIVAFIAARYDVLHCAQAIIALATGDPHVPSTSAVGTVSHEVLQAMAFTADYTPNKQTQFWYNVMQTQKAAIRENRWSMSYLFVSMQRALEDRFTMLATTPFMKSLASSVKSRHEHDAVFRQHTSATDATQYEWEWDAKTIDLVRGFRFDPVGYDAIIAYWITKEMEVKSINLIYAALANGFSKEEARLLLRSPVRV